MNKTRKGITLVEVIVSIAVFTIISLALFTSFLGMRKVVAKQEEYVRLEMVCHDINYYWDMYGDAWDENYFGDGIVSNKGIGYLKYEDGKFIPMSQKSNYEIQYSLYYYIVDVEGNHTICKSDVAGAKIGLRIDCIKTKDRVYVENVYCGESKGGQT